MSVIGAAEPVGCLLPPDPPWSVRVARTTGGGPAVEVYLGEFFVDVVASSRSRRLLRGACTGVVTGQPHTIAWGCLPASGGLAPGLEFIPRRIFPQPRLVTAENISSWFWLATASGRFARVSALSHDTRESCQVRLAGRY